MRRLRLRLLLALLVPALTIGACDTNTLPGPLIFDGVELMAAGDARLAVEGGQLIVSGLDGNRSGGFTVPGSPSRVDVDIAPLAVPPGGRFGSRVNDASGAEMASVYTQADATGRLNFLFSLADTFELTGVVLRYRLGGRIVFEFPLDFSNLRQGGRIAGSGGSGTGEPGSTHVIRDRGKYIVVADADEQGGRQRDGCGGFLVTPPPPLDVEHPDPICTDWVEVEPVLQTTMPQGQVSVTARGVGRFVVRDLVVTSSGDVAN